MTHAQVWFFECDDYADDGHGDGWGERCGVQVRSYDARYGDAKAEAERIGWLFEGKFNCYCPLHAAQHKAAVEEAAKHNGAA